MRKHQVILKWRESEKSGRHEALLPMNSPDWGDIWFYRLTSEGARRLPVPIVHGKTAWQLSPGHDIRINGKVVSVSSSSPVKDAPLLAEWGDKVFLKCPQGHRCPDEALFCPHCGEKTGE